MGGCFSSSGSDEEEGCQPTRVWPSDQDGMPCVGERDVDNEARIYIENFHRKQSDGSGTEVPPTPAPAPAAV